MSLILQSSEEKDLRKKLIQTLEKRVDEMREQMNKEIVERCMSQENEKLRQECGKRIIERLNQYSATTAVSIVSFVCLCMFELTN